MNRKNSFLSAFSAILLVASVGANALSVEFITPDGVVGPNDSIEVWVRMTADSGDFTFDGSDPAGDGSFGGIDPSLVPTEAYSFNANGGMGGFVTIDTIFDAITIIGFSCSGSFAGDDGSVCPPGANYTFEFNDSGQDAFGGQSSYSLASGASEDFLFGTFVPVAGGAAPGEYDFFGAIMALYFFAEGYDDLGDLQTLNAFVPIATTCSTGDTSCDFTRTVVPVPAAAWLFGSALLGLFGMRGRSRQA